MQQLVDSFRARESLEANLTKVAERDPLVQPSDQPVRDRLREQHLAAIGERHDACRAVERRPQVVVAMPLGLPGVQATTDSERDPGRQCRVGECQLGRDDCGDTVGRIREHGHNAVAARLDHPPAILLDGIAQQRVMRRDGLRHALGLLLPLLGAALDVSKEERRRPGNVVLRAFRGRRASGSGSHHRSGEQAASRAHTLPLPPINANWEATAGLPIAARKQDCEKLSLG